ncbi:SNF1-interacting protein [Sporothrix epigloea]|uniref:SNF1-interacting protein n=1 Tax=Sporothrix epigloea TaxID=1892477 RepID=A0ABP0DHK7_9PEZI
MGNASTKEHRPEGGTPGNGQAAQIHGAYPSGSRPRGRSSRSTDLSGLLGIAGQSAPGSHGAPERRETRQEREARRLERERQARLVERERSLREEHVDGGYLVTLGTYVGPEDFNKSIVRQLQIERRLAPFWRGLSDFSNTWTEYQLTAAARGLDIPPPDQPPPEDFFSSPPTLADSPPKSAAGNASTGSQVRPSTAVLAESSSTSQPGTSSPARPPSANAPGAPLAGTSSPAAVPQPSAVPRGTSSSSPFKPRAKALAATLSLTSRNSSSTDIARREIKLPHDPYINGQPIEVFLYKDADECPICFLSYPPYLNHTRCCGQDICSECFVQIKRADPHYPEGHGDNNNGESAAAHDEEQPTGQLISEPACCPFCQQPEFGVTYDSPPFLRGLVYSSSSLAPGVGAMGAAMSSNSSINSSSPSSALLSPNGGSPPATAGSAVTPVSRRRAQSLSANAPNVITTDRIRPDWATKLASQSAHIARRAAAATALHTAAFLMGGTAPESRSFRVSRFSRRNTSSSSVAGDAVPNQSGSDVAAGAGDGSSSMEPGPRLSSGRVALLGPAGNRRTRIEDLEELMFREALRQSLATEEERRRKEEKEERKESKRREKEERKAQKAGAKRKVYNAGADSNQSSASASTLSLPGLGHGLGLSNRRRGNSVASNLRVEASVANAMAVTGSGSPTSNALSPSAAASAGPAAGAGKDSVATNDNSSILTSTTPDESTAQDNDTTCDKGKAVDRGLGSSPPTGPEIDTSRASTLASSIAPSATSAPRLIPSSQPSAGPSHLRQMSIASSVDSSLPDSAAGSYANPLHLQDPRASGTSLENRSDASEDGDHQDGPHDDRHDDNDPSASTEPLFNFGSLAAVVGVQIEGKNAGRRLSAIGREEHGVPVVDGADSITGTSPLKESDSIAEHVEHVEHGDVAAAPKDAAETLNSAE